MERYDWTSLSDASDPLPEELESLESELLDEVLLEEDSVLDAAVVVAGGGVDEVVGAGCSTLEVVAGGGVN